MSEQLGWFELFAAQFLAAALAGVVAATVAVLLARRLEITGGAATARRRRRMHRAGRQHRRKSAKQLKLPSPDTLETELETARWPRKWMLIYQIHRIHRLDHHWRWFENRCSEEYRDAAFDNKMNEYLTDNPQQMQEDHYMAAIAEEIVRRSHRLRRRGGPILFWLWPRFKIDRTRLPERQRDRSD